MRKIVIFQSDVKLNQLFSHENHPIKRDLSRGVQNNFS